jgi:hypothetical protein
MLSLAYFFNLMELLKAIFEVNVAIILDIFILSRWVLYYLADLMVIIFLNKARVPFYGEM